MPKCPRTAGTAQGRQMQTSSEPAFYWIGLNSVPGVGRITFRKLVQQFGSPEQVLTAPQNVLKETDGLSDKILAGIASQKWREQAEKELASAAQAGVAIITLDDDRFPENLRNTPDPPLYLYVRGSIEPDDKRAVAIVGTRTPTHYGRTVTQRFGYELASAGLTVVSGMARGVDTQAHQGALDAGGRTIAVLGCGIDRVYPPENRGLMHEISTKGAVVTEYPFGTRPEAGFFPARNRIISGLSRGTVIIEAAEDSGSLITAGDALKQGRKLFAVPGNVSAPNSRGPNNLIKQGAMLVEQPADVLNALNMRPGSRREGGQANAPLSEEESALFRHVAVEPRHIDAITSECGNTAGKTGGLLLSLELKGLVRQLPGKYFVRSEE